MRKISILVIFLIIKLSCFGQYENFTNQIIPHKNLFKKIFGDFNPVTFETIQTSDGIQKVPYGFKFNSTETSIEYYRSKQAELNDSSCSKFIILGSIFFIKGHFINDFACDMDISSLNVYFGSFNNQKYILITGINCGSGSSTTTIILNLFNVTNKNHIIYYPLWSKYGGLSSFGDFNGDGCLDFFEVRNFKEQFFYKGTVMSLKEGKFLPFHQNNYFIIFKYDGNSIITLTKNWFN